MMMDLFYSATAYGMELIICAILAILGILLILDKKNCSADFHV